MARYLGPTCRKARRLGTDLRLKSGSIDNKCKAGTPPGSHGQKRVRTTDYGLQLRAKQRIRFMYGVLERQFHRYYTEASRRKGATGAVLLQLLETRLDNVVYRMGFAVTRAEARQLVRHGAVTVNGSRVSIPSYAVEAGNTIEIREKSKEQTRIKDAVRLAESNGVPEWLSLDSSKLNGIFKRVPDRSELPAELEEQLVVELYSK